MRDKSPSRMPPLKIRHLYFLLFDDLRNRVNLLLAQTRHAYLVSNYITAAELASLDDLAFSSRHAEAHLLRLLEAVDSSCVGLAKLGDEPHLGYIDERTKHLQGIFKQLGRLRTIQRTLAQELDAIPLEYSRPAAFHGLEQFEILEAVTDTARCYVHSLAHYGAKLRPDLGLALQQRPILINISYEQLPSPRHKASPPSREDPTLSIFARLPIWYAYMPRYLPNIAHEVAHPIADLASELGPESPYKTSLHTCALALQELFRRFAGPDFLKHIGNLENIILRETLADLLALRVGGPAYILSLAHTAWGIVPLSTKVRIDHPLSVRLRVLIKAASRLFPALGDSWKQIFALLEHELARYQLHLAQSPKWHYHEILRGILSHFTEEMVEVWGLLEPPPVQRRPVVTESYLRFIASQFCLPQFEGFHSPVELAEVGDCIARGGVEAAPNVIWLTQFLNSEKQDLSGSKYVPEGRIFHEWHRLVHAVSPARAIEALSPSSLRQALPELGEYFEVLFWEVLWGRTERVDAFSRMRSSIQGTLDTIAHGHVGRANALGVGHGVYSILGLYDIVTIRSAFQAKRFDSRWPVRPPLLSKDPDTRQDEHAPFPFFTHRHIGQLLKGWTFMGHSSGAHDQILASEALLACTQVRFKENPTLGEMLAMVEQRLWPSAPSTARLVGILSSLGWEHLLLFWQLPRVGALNEVLSQFLAGSGDAFVRTISQLFLPSSMAPILPVPSRRRVAPTPSECLRLSIHARAARPERWAAAVRRFRDLLVPFGGEASPCFGREDIIATVDASDVEDLCHLTGVLQQLTHEGLVTETSTRLCLPGAM